MLFNSLTFAVFFPVVFALFYLTPHRHRWLVLLIASYVFYMGWEPAYALLMFASTVFDYATSNRMPDATARGKKVLLGISLALNFALLGSFKYYNLINDTFTGVAAMAGVDWPLPRSNLLLPVGISFYTFQTVGYTIDVYRGTIPPERHFGYFALYVSYFPQLVAGPIERAGNLIPQLHRHVLLNWERIASGFRQASWGMFKKVVVADRLAEVVNPIYDNPQEFSGFAFLLGTFLFAWQLYCDFSGYSDIAIGTARMLGVDLMVNFDQPHGSRSYREIWTRWHISLTTWFRDYLYFPLGGNRVSQPRWALNILVVFVLSGMWHGATWAFAAWGAMNGMFLIVEHFTLPLRERIAVATGFDRWTRTRHALQVGCTFFLWCVTLVFFRSKDLDDALYMVAHVGEGWSRFGDPMAFLFFLSRVNLDVAMFLYCLLLIPLVEFVDWSRRTERMQVWWRALSTPARWSLDYAVVLGTLVLGNFTHAPFMYFQF